ncbi:exodeoxyribonuclease V subunit alpha [Allohahella marinimesophila]|uniref:RecBCD enzyme subunit RecD n=1 Tax=Allohahella marinimesophila TaxID=1054972 RepID=A0ABP7NHX5_9GAMM
MNHIFPQTPEAMLALLDSWLAADWLRALDVAFARLLDSQAATRGESLSPLLLLAAALTSHQVGRGHVCLHIGQLTSQDPDAILVLPPENAIPEEVGESATVRPSSLLSAITLKDWESALNEPSTVGGVPVDSSFTGSTPLVRVGPRLYLRRFWTYEQIISDGIRSRLAVTVPCNEPDSQAASQLREALDAMFGAEGTSGSQSADWQKIACALAARSQFSIITGGPGTGKTTTVLRLLMVLQSVAMRDLGVRGTRPLRIRLAAPTGKAAARLSESISGSVDALSIGDLPEGDRLRLSIPTVVTTLHRLLGSRPGTRLFRHHAGNPLPIDVLVIDEASMVDVEMMAAVFQALPPHARLILLGDKDQLSSVDAGAVLGELCQRANEGGYTPATAQWLQQIAKQQLDQGYIVNESDSSQGRAIDQSITMLRKTWRFGDNSGIKALAELINAGRLDAAALEPFQGGSFSDLAWLKVRGSSAASSDVISMHALTGSPASFPMKGSLADAWSQDGPFGYQHYLEIMRKTRPAVDAGSPAFDDWAKAVLEAFSRFQVLCALRAGPFGVAGLNELIAEALNTKKLIQRNGSWYAGRPVLVTRNDYSLKLMNGDVGITLSVPASVSAPSRESPSTRILRVAFPMGDGSGGIRWVSPSRLQAVDTVYAMTVHKSQGSEFAHTCLVLPDRSSPVLTRELIYTGITRARNWFSLIVPDEQTFLDAARHRVVRSSGLGELLGLSQ